MRHVLILSFFITTSCFNYPNKMGNDPNYRYMPSYMNNNYNTQVPRPYPNQAPYNAPRNYGYYTDDYDSQYRVPYRAYRSNEARQQYYRPHTDNDQAYYYNYPPRNSYRTQNYYPNQYQNNNYQNQPTIDNDYEVAR